MELTEAFVKFQSGLPHVHHLFALLCFVVVLYKLTILLAKRRETFRNTEAFPGPPAHWLFGHVLQVSQVMSAQ